MFPSLVILRNSIVGAALLALFWSSPLNGEPPDGFQQVPASQTIRVNTVLVRVPVIVSNHAGRYVSGLARADFALFDDGEPQEIALFSAEKESVHVALLLDTSKSTWAVLEKIKKAANRFLKEMRPQDQAMVVSFDHVIRTLCPHDFRSPAPW